MKIAFVVPYVPNRIRTRPYNLIRHLVKAGHEVSVFTLGSNAREKRDANVLRAECHDVIYHQIPAWRTAINCLLALPTRVPLQAVYSWDVQLARRLVSALQSSFPRFDVVHVEHLRGSRFALFAMQECPEVPIIWDSVDCISNLFDQAARNGSNFFGKIVTRFELGRTRIAEAQLIRVFPHILTTSNADKTALMDLPYHGGEVSPISVLPGGVDLQYFHPNPAVEVEADTLVFSGKMSYHANIAMAAFLVQHIMPRIWRRNPHVRLVIAGKDPDSRITGFSSNPLVQVTGTVEDIRPYLWKASAAVVPLVYGAGIQNKVIEAMACGTPVVTNSRALSALHVTPGREVLVGDDPDGFSAEILRLLEDTTLRDNVRQAGLNYVKANHDWNGIVSQLTGIYENTIQRHRSGPKH